MGDSDRRFKWHTWRAVIRRRPFVRWHRYVDHFTVRGGFGRRRWIAVFRLDR